LQVKVRASRTKKLSLEQKSIFLCSTNR
jgi:hypothetical protein